MGSLFPSSHGILATREYERRVEEEQWPIGWTYSGSTGRLSRNLTFRSADGSTSPLSPRLTSRGTASTRGEEKQIREQRRREEAIQQREEDEAARRNAARRQALRAAEAAADSPLPTRTPPPPGRSSERDEYRRWREQLEREALLEMKVEEAQRALAAATRARDELERAAAPRQREAEWYSGLLGKAVGQVAPSMAPSLTPSIAPTQAAATFEAPTAFAAERRTSNSPPAPVPQHAVAEPDSGSDQSGKERLALPCLDQPDACKIM